MEQDERFDENTNPWGLVWVAHGLIVSEPNLPVDF